MKIAYYPAGTSTFASSRMRVWKVAAALSEMGHTVTFNEPYLGGVDIMFVQKRADVTALMISARQAGIPIIYDADDWIPSLPTEFADIITTDTHDKKRLWKNAVVVPDCLDIDDVHPPLQHSEKLNLVGWTGNAENLYHLKNAALACNHLHIAIVAITNLNNPCMSDQLNQLSGIDIQFGQWELATIDEQLRLCDLFISPFITGGRWSQDWVQSKSANRILKAWGLGLPVAATPIPAYVDAGLCYHAASYDDWLETLVWLQNRELRERDADRGHKAALEFTADKVALLWIEVFEHAKTLTRTR